MTKLIIAFRNFAKAPNIPGNFHEDLSTFYCYQRNKFALKTLNSTLNIFILLIVTCSSTVHREHIVAFLLQKFTVKTPQIHVSHIVELIAGFCRSPFSDLLVFGKLLNYRHEYYMPIHW